MLLLTMIAATVNENHELLSIFVRDRACCSSGAAEGKGRGGETYRTAQGTELCGPKARGLVSLPGDKWGQASEIIELRGHQDRRGSDS